MKKLNIKKITLLIFKTLLILFIIGTILVTTVGLFVTAQIINDIPQGNERESMLFPEQTIVYDKNGDDVFTAGMQRESISLDELPEVFVNAVLAAEDSTFFSHDGINKARFFMAALQGGEGGGASTLTMQISKLYLTQKGEDETTIEKVERKIEDIYIATQILENEFTKQEIFETYVNSSYLGNGATGVQAAAWNFFSKDARDLNLLESAFIAGQFQLPVDRDPTLYGSTYGEARRNQVLYYMERHGYITTEEYETAIQVPLASYLNPSESFNNIEPEYVDYINLVMEEAKEKTGLDPYTNTMKIYTNMDPVVQEHLYTIKSDDDYRKDEKFLYGGAVIDNSDGTIAGVLAGPEATVTSFNYATGLHHPGSTAKPLISYAPCFDQGNCTSVNETILDEEYKYSDGSNIENWDGKYFNQMTLTSALNLSRNIPALKVFQRNDSAKTLAFIESLGLNQGADGGNLFESHSIGGYDGESPVSLAAAYSAFARGGVYSEPNSVSRIIVDYHIPSRTEVYEYSQKDTVVMSSSTAAAITHMLNYKQGGLNSAIGGRIGDGKYINVSYKTGTSNWPTAKVNAVGTSYDIRDNWMVAYTPEYSTALWTGYDILTEEYVKNGWVMGWSDSYYRNQIMYEMVSGPHQPDRSVGASFPSADFGTDKVLVEGEFEDKDEDGVADEDDKCPNAGGTVDEDGCPIDTDGDGIADDDDRCPNTPPGDLVDSNGCTKASDADGDGVADNVDRCPNTPSGQAVNTNGCSLNDRDGDGVTDQLDDCPDVPGDSSNGCPSDSDADGVIDSEDRCPNTPPGDIVDEYGCTI